MNHPLFERFPHGLQLSPDLEIEWMTRGHDFFLRPLGAGVDIVWCQLNGRNIADNLGLPDRRVSAQRPLLNSWIRRSFWRFLPLENGRELALRQNFGLIRRDGDDFWLRATWRKPCSLSRDELLLGSGAAFNDIEKLLEQVAHFEEASVLFHERQSSWRWFCCARGDFDELQRLVGAYITLTGGEARCYGNGPLSMQAILRPPSGTTPTQWKAKWHFAELLDAHFTLRARDFTLRLHDAGGRSRGQPSLHLQQNGAPTMHEKLEARLLLREWLDGKLSPEHLEVLLSPP